MAEQRSLSAHRAPSRGMMRRNQVTAARSDSVQLEMFGPASAPVVLEPPLPPTVSPVLPAPAGASGQLALFQLARAHGDGRALSGLPGPGAPQSYLELACALGLIQLQRLLQCPAEGFLFDALELRRELRARTVLAARELLLAQLQQQLIERWSVPDGAGGRGTTPPPEAQLVVWGSHLRGVAASRSPEGEVLCLSLSSYPAALIDWLGAGLRAIPGFLQGVKGSSPLDDGDELLGILSGGAWYAVAPFDAQTLPLERLLLG